MGACMSTDGNAERKGSEAINGPIKENSGGLTKECKILLLGCPESGKSTIVKQMKIIYQNGYLPDELAFFRPLVYKNLVDSAKDIVLAIKKIGVEFAETINRTHAAQILDYEVGSYASFRLSPDIANAIDSLWKDPIISTVTDRLSEFYLMDSAGYFFSQVQRIAQRDYIPNESDVLRVRVETRVIHETRLNMGTLSIQMVDFDSGRFRGERKKWVHYFKAATSVIFCVALSEYDQVLSEDKEQTRMEESFVHFEAVVNSRWFSRTSMILFLNKIDVFKDKLPKVPLERYFPEYTGGPDIGKATKYIMWKFAQVNRARLKVYPHLTQATDTSNIQLIFTAIKETLLQDALRDSEIL